MSDDQTTKENTMDDVEPMFGNNVYPAQAWAAVTDIARLPHTKYIPFELCAGDPGAVIAGMVSLVAISE